MSLWPVTMSESRCAALRAERSYAPANWKRLPSCCVRSTIPVACFLVIFDSKALIGSICEHELTRE
jgi:hypothetical protein